MIPKQPVSVLVVIHTPELDVLLLERANHPGYWQSVTGSLEIGEQPATAALRELKEETGIAIPVNGLLDWRISNRYEIFPEWRHRYTPEITHNTEHVFSVCLPQTVPIILAPTEHRTYRWVDREIAAHACFSWSNRDAILMLDAYAPAPPPT